MSGIVHRLREMDRLMVGQPRYEAYLAHEAQDHLEAAPMTRLEFFRNREAARFSGAGGGKC